MTRFELPLLLSAARNGPWTDGRNGGAMGRSKLDQEKRKKDAEKKAIAKDSNTELPEALKTSEGKAPKKPVKLGAKKALRKAIKDEMNREGAKKIAEALVKRTVEGDMHSSEMLMTLVEGKKDEDKTAKKKKKRSGPSLAELLASEPEWVDPEPNPTVEAGMGGKEPEKTHL